MADITTPAVLTAEHPGGLQTPHRSIRATFNRSLGRYAAASVTIEHPMSPVTGDTLRRTPVRRLVADGLRAQLLAANPHLSDPVYKTWTKGDTAHARPMARRLMQEPTPEILQEAETILILERLIGGHPVKTLQRCLGIDDRTARKWSRQLSKH